MHHRHRSWEFIYWEKGLGLLTLPIIKPFLPAIGITHELEQHLDSWTELYVSARSNVLNPAKKSLISQTTWKDDRNREIEILNQALIHFGERSSEQALEDLCCWFYCNYLHHDYLRAIGDWRSILTKAILLDDDSSEKEQPPEVLKSLILEIEEVIWWQIEDYRSQILQLPITLPETLGKESAAYELSITDATEAVQLHGIPIGHPGMIYDRIMDHLTLDALCIIHENPQAQTAEQWLTSLSDSSRLINFSILETIAMSREEIV